MHRFMPSVILLAYKIAVPFILRAARPIVWRRAVSDRKNPTLPAFKMATKETWGRSNPSRKRLTRGGSYAEWISVPWEAGNLTAIARSANGTELASTERRTSGDAVRLLLSLDCPSKATGTGEAHLLDGQDVALVRAAVLDGSDQVVHMATHNITFTVICGPGVIQGTANGDPASYEPHNALWHSAYDGLVRAVVRVTSIAAFSLEERALLQDIDGRMSNQKIYDDNGIVVEANSPGLDPVRLIIPTSTDSSRSSVLAVATAGAGQSVDFFGGTTTVLQKTAGQPSAISLA